MSNPTEIQRIINIEKSFEEILEKNELNKMIKYFKIHQNEKNYNKYIITYLSTQIDLNYQYKNDSITNIYLLDDKYAILAYYVNGIFSTYDEYLAGIIFSTFSEEQELLNNLNVLQTVKKVNVNLLTEPIANLLLGVFNNIQPNFLYYLVSVQSDIKKNYPNYSLVSFIYKTININ